MPPARLNRAADPRPFPPFRAFYAGSVAPSSPPDGQGDYATALGAGLARAQSGGEKVKEEAVHRDRRRQADQRPDEIVPKPDPR